MSVFHVDPKRFMRTGPADESAEKQRVTLARDLIPNARPDQDDNGDFERFDDKRGTFTKGLAHGSDTGLADSGAVSAFAAAMRRPRDQVFQAIESIDAVHLGAGNSTRHWVNPVAGRAFSVAGGDPQQYVLPPAPRFASAELSLEMVENYWMALLRDVPFSQYESSPLAGEAAGELTAFHAAVGSPRQLVPLNESNQVTPGLLFRGLTPGDRVGPYISQFLIHPVPFGVQGFHQRNKTLRAGQDFMTRWDDWLWVQRGAPRDFISSHFDDQLHYLRNGRDLSQWVHIDVLFQGYFNACLSLLQGAGTPSSVGGGIGGPRADTNPYGSARRQDGFGTLGDPAHIAMMCEVAPLALKAVWFQKWYVHLRLRPEVYAARIHRDLHGTSPLFDLPADLLGSKAVGATQSRFGSALLPMAFPEGSPMHPAYGAGHATVAGACVTILKALFRGDAAFPNPVDVVVDSTGHEHLVPYNGDALTIEGELNKLASNIAIGRNIAGVHWRSDGTESMALGEQVAIDLLRAYAKGYVEFSPGDVVFEFTRFDGGTQTIRA
ncbi:MAG: vanadium-dependent haloperoxidase [Pirellulaceae bacterium]|nr:vanadium-dependent haloperoxidase [Pirellulaceae bacterium]